MKKQYKNVVVNSLCKRGVCSQYFQRMENGKIKHQVYNIASEKWSDVITIGEKEAEIINKNLYKKLLKVEKEMT